MLNPIVQAALATRIRTCVAGGLCLCTEEGIDPGCPCHTIDGIAFNDTERAIAPSVIEVERGVDDSTQAY